MRRIKAGQVWASAEPRSIFRESPEAVFYFGVHECHVNAAWKLRENRQGEVETCINVAHGAFGFGGIGFGTEMYSNNNDGPAKTDER
jgi:hypothetical protein